MRVAVLGKSGRMGRLLCNEIAESQKASLSDVADCDVIIDFTVAAAIPDNVAKALEVQKPYLCCVTGIDDAPLKIASSVIPVMYAANTSLSFMVFRLAVAQVAKQLSGYDVHIHDEHHKAKVDAPSGSAKALGVVMSQPVTYSSLRAGNIIGEHEIVFTGIDETIRMRHVITDRRVFARGALRVAHWLQHRQKGLYKPEDTLQL